MLVLLATGCFTIDRAKAPPVMGADAVEHLIIYNYGWSLFGCIPLCCGNRNLDSWLPVVFFRDDVTHEALADNLVKIADRANCDFRDLMIFDDRCVFFDMYYAPVPWIIQYKEIAASATLVRKGVAK